MHTAEPIVLDHSFGKDETAIEKSKTCKLPSTNQIPKEEI
jgi:hypothetical protein